MRPSGIMHILLVSTAAVQAGGGLPTRSLDGLIQNPPFGALAVQQGKGQANGPLEFRGVMVEDGESYFSLFEPTSRSSLWVRLNEPGNPYTVQAYDRIKETVQVEYQGQQLTLPLKQAKIQALAQATPASPPPHGASTIAAVEAQVNSESTVPAEHAAQLAAVADEIRRRREARRLALQATSPDRLIQK